MITYTTKGVTQKKTMNIVIIDNYDSFTYNLVHLIASLGANVTVLKNDNLDLVQLENFDKIVLSPGPGLPEEAGKTMDVIKTYASIKPILGVCLGHQAIALAYGASLTNLPTVCHGLSTIGLNLGNDPIFKGLPAKVAMGRYHSWVVTRESVCPPLEITALSDDGLVMGIRHKHLKLHGIQFHPESILTPEGKTIVNNWLYND
ncbi:anthranilate synthase component 2 [Hoylesella shahii DSM 15611 = JCM 12083]|jgi:hypothetical protein|uniref:Anthranilate synthase component 2 n=2 Tax=Hoylesella shahii TaxID=228603 RepID=A0A318IIJ7_9BACT|nr:anthranilate synthase component 2 [Hoylesella shahii DSM 15611 = JCM 12083]